MSDLDRIKELAGVESLDEGVVRETTANPQAMFDEITKLMAKGKRLTVMCRESHVGDVYKGQIITYSIKWK